MKLNAWQLFVLTPLTAVSVLAQVSNSAPPVIEPPAPAAAVVAPPAINAPAAPKPKAKHHKAKAKAKASEEKEKAKAKKEPEAAVKNGVIVLNPPVAATVKCNVLDVRGQGSFAGETITYAKKGENVTVLEEITLAHPHGGEPAQWSRILMPSNTAVWVSGDYIDPESKAVRVKKVNVRGGPGENYSVIARLEKGDIVNEIGKKNGWVEIESPTNAYAFVASEYLETAATQPPAPEAAAAPVPAPAPTPVPAPAPAPPVVVNVPPPETAPAPAKAVENPPAAGLTAPAPTAASQSDQELAALHRATASEPMVVPNPNLSPAQAESGKEDYQRIVTREGFVHHALNIQAPAGYELHDIKTGELTEYLLPAPGQKFKVFVGTRVRISGPEFLDPDWPRTPVLHVQSVDLMP